MNRVLKTASFDTILGPMCAISDDDELYLLEFLERASLNKKIAKLQTSMGASMIQAMSNPIRAIESELKDYFTGTLRKFNTPLSMLGSLFQKTVWSSLMQVPYGETLSYSAQAEAISKPSAYRAVANANGANQLAIVVPCHRIINRDGSLGGYGGGLKRKQWLIEHESACIIKNSIK